MLFRIGLYGAAGLFFGSIIGLLLDTNYNLGLFSMVIGGLIGAFLCGLLGFKISKIEKHSVENHGYFHLVGTVFSIYVVCKAILNASLLYFFPAVLDTFFVALIVDTITTIVFVWIAVSYVVRKGYLTLHHDSAKLALFSTLLLVFVTLYLIIRYHQNLAPVFLFSFVIETVIFYSSVLLLTKKIQKSHF